MFRPLLLLGVILPLGSALAQDTSTFVDISNSYNQICALDSDNEVFCNQAIYSKRLKQPENLPTMSDIAVGLQHACAITAAEGSVFCWGDNDFGQLDAPEDAVFTSIDAGFHHTCAITTDGTLECWGLDNFGQTSGRSQASSTETYTQIAVTGDQSCALDNNGFIQCWGITPSGFRPQSPVTQNLAVIDFTSSYGFEKNSLEQCALMEDGFVDCFNSPDQFDFSNSTYTDVASIRGIMCGLTSERSQLYCQDRGDDGRTALSDYIQQQIIEINNTDPFISIEGGNSLCGITATGAAKCISLFTSYEDNGPFAPGQSQLQSPAPQNLRAEIYSDSTLELLWEQGEASIFIIGYAEILRNGEVLDTTNGLTSYLDNTIQPGVVYEYQVRYVGIDGINGELSNLIIVNGATGPDGPETGSYTPPARPFQPADVQALVYSDSLIELQWSRVQTASLGYEIRRDGIFIGYTTGISYVDKQANASSQHVYEILAVDGTGTILGVSLIKAFAH